MCVSSHALLLLIHSEYILVDDNKSGLLCYLVW